MARKKKKKRKLDDQTIGLFDDLSSHTKQTIGAVIMLLLAIFFTLSLLDYAGPAGQYTNWVLRKLFGLGSWLAPLISLIYIYVLLHPSKITQQVSTPKIIGTILLFVSLLSGLGLYEDGLGGILGKVTTWPLSYFFDNLVSGILIFGLVIISIFLIFNTGIKIPDKNTTKEKGKSSTDETKNSDSSELNNNVGDNVTEQKSTTLTGSKSDSNDYKGASVKKLINKVTNLTSVGNVKNSSSDKKSAGNISDIVIKNFSGPYVPPPLTLLDGSTQKPRIGDIKANANIIKQTLADFGISVEMDAVESGPTITRYALKPAQGVRISKIASLHQELQLALKAETIRIEAPIPGRSLVGIEVPNQTRATVRLRSMLATPEYADSTNPLVVALGKDVTGQAHFSDVAKMPHGLIAGATGAGKSVTMHNLILSLLFRNSPEQLRFIMIDPKRVEMTMYNNIPHLLTPVITGSKKTLQALSWAISEMERRYEILEENKLQKISSYHKKIYNPAKEKFDKLESEEKDSFELPESLPYIVIVLDELNDLMQAYPRELEALIVRLTQKSRAVGIHLILATQRPSVNVITGTIKANVPTRIALMVASQIDSRTIIDTIGAEKLLGQGDMLYVSSNSPKPVRLQSAYVSEEEIQRVVSYLKKQDAYKLDMIDLDDKTDISNDAVFNSVVGGNKTGKDDELYEEAREIVIRENKASTSLLQRRLGVGYARGAKLIDLLEERGVIGPANGSKAREVLQTELTEENDEKTNNNYDYNEESNNDNNELLR